jgi:putative addiction module component (TIGR02574 family)
MKVLINRKEVKDELVARMDAYRQGRSKAVTPEESKQRIAKLLETARIKSTNDRGV